MTFGLRVHVEKRRKSPLAITSIDETMVLQLVIRICHQDGDDEPHSEFHQIRKGIVAVLLDELDDPRSAFIQNIGLGPCAADRSACPGHLLQGRIGNLVASLDGPQRFKVDLARHRCGVASDNPAISVRKTDGPLTGRVIGQAEYVTLAEASTVQPLHPHATLGIGCRVLKRSGQAFSRVTAAPGRSEEGGKSGAWANLRASSSQSCA